MFERLISINRLKLHNTEQTNKQVKLLTTDYHHYYYVSPPTSIGTHFRNQNAHKSCCHIYLPNLSAMTPDMKAPNIPNRTKIATVIDQSTSMMGSSSSSTADSDHLSVTLEGAGDTDGSTSTDTSGEAVSLLGDSCPDLSRRTLA